MQANQAKINQDVAIALERLNGRMESFELWRKGVDDERQRDNERRNNRDDKKPDAQRANLALLVSALSALIYFATFLSQHWR